MRLKTDKELLVTLFQDFGIELDEDTTYPTVVTLEAPSGNVRGTKGAMTNFIFDEDGGFICVDLWYKEQL